MKTTLEISTPLFRKIKKMAEKQGVTFRSITELALQKFLESQKKTNKKFKLKQYTFKGKGLVEGLQEGDWISIRNKVYEGRGG